MPSSASGSGGALEGNNVRFDPRGRKGHVESYFLKANSPDGERAVWLKFTFFAPPGDRSRAVGEVWLVVFDRRGKQHLAAKRTFPIGECRFSGSPLLLRFGDDCQLSLSDGLLKTTGSVESAGERFSFDLTLTPAAAPFWPYAMAKMYEWPLPKFKLLSPIPSALVRGEVRCSGHTGDTRLVLDGWRGMQGHNWGVEHTFAYAWAQSSAFEGQPETTWFEGFTARIKLGPLVSPPLTIVALQLGGARYAWNKVSRLVAPRTHTTYTGWTFVAEGDAGELVGKANTTAADMVGLKYHNPRGPMAQCLNSKLASLELRFTPRGGEAVLLRSNQAALEIVTRNSDHGIRLYV